MAWAHILLVLGFGAYLPYSKHLHIISSEPNVYFRSLEPRGALRKMDLEAEPEDGEELRSSARRACKDLTWRHLLDPLACTECGRCMEFCPASVTGKTLQPEAPHGGPARPDPGGRDRAGGGGIGAAGVEGGSQRGRGGFRGRAAAGARPAPRRRSACRSSTTPSRRRRSGSAPPAAGASRAARC